MSLLPGGTATVSGTFTGGAPTGLLETVDGAAVAVLNPVITVTSGAGPTAAGTFSYQFVVPAAGMHSIHIAGTGSYQAAIDYVPPAAPATPVVPSPAFFVAANGSDANPGTQAAPFATFEAALAAMAGGSTKTTCVRGGFYPRTSSITFNAQHSGTTLTRYPGEVPVIDGGGSVTDLVLIKDHVTGVVVNGLEICRGLNSGVHLAGYRTSTDDGTITGCVIENNDIHSIANGVSNVGAGNTGGVRLSFATRNNTVRNNKIADTFGPSVSIVAGSPDETIAGNQVLNNIFERSNNTNQPDTGCIYLLDRGHGSISKDPVTIAGNYIDGSGGGPATKAIYLDDHTSIVNVTGNILRGQMCNAFQIHGGDHVVFSGNIFDLTNCTEQPAYFQEATNSYPGNYGMGFDVVSGNIFYHGGTPPARDIWLYETDGVSPMGVPAVANNNYYGVGGAWPNTGTVLDSNPKAVNPMFRNPAGGDYGFSDGGAAVMAAIGFQPIDMSLIGPNTQTMSAGA